MKLKVVDFNFSNEKDVHKLAAIANALSSEIRINLIKQLREKSYTIAELKKLNNISYSSVLFHLNILSELNIIHINYLPGQKGFAQVVSIRNKDLLFELVEDKPKETTLKQSLGVGCFVNHNVIGYCGLAGVDFTRMGLNIDLLDSRRFNASLIWAQEGFIEYSFSNNAFIDKEIKELRISLEICSEARQYREDWKSDITFSINGKELCTWQSPGDFGERRGTLTPPSWPSCNTQYGLLINLCVNKNGVYINEKKYSSSVRIDDLNINKGKGILFKIDSKADAVYKGGWNIFGRHFGDYNQDIDLFVTYK